VGALQAWCIQQVKDKIRGILEELAVAHPRTPIRVAFVAYRDFGCIPQTEVGFASSHRPPRRHPCSAA
jgi:hypothetical protein